MRDFYTQKYQRPAEVTSKFLEVFDKVMIKVKNKEPVKGEK